MLFMKGDAPEGDRGMYTQGVGCDQSDSWPQGQFLGHVTALAR